MLSAPSAAEERPVDCRSKHGAYACEKRRSKPATAPARMDSDKTRKSVAPVIVYLTDVSRPAKNERQSMSHHFDSPTGREDPRLNLCYIYIFPGSPGRTVTARTVNASRPNG